MKSNYDFIVGSVSDSAIRIPIGSGIRFINLSSLSLSFLWAKTFAYQTSHFLIWKFTSVFPLGKRIFCVLYNDFCLFDSQAGGCEHFRCPACKTEFCRICSALFYNPEHNTVRNRIVSKMKIFYCLSNRSVLDPIVHWKKLYMLIAF